MLDTLQPSNNVQSAARGLQGSVTSASAPGSHMPTPVLESATGAIVEGLPFPSCPYGGGHFELRKDGVYFIGTHKDGGEQPAKWICSPLAIVAMTRDEKSGEWGRLLVWQDNDGVKHRWAMPMEKLEGDGNEVRCELARLGLHIAQSQGARSLLAAYVKAWPVEARAICADRLGWHGDVYVLPEGVIGEGGEAVEFQNAHAIEPAHGVAGTADEWRENVSALASGNSRLMLAIATAFAAPLADIAGEESGGFHFRGASSTGKSTALKLAASVWGNPARYVRQWNATLNGLEGLAALHNDGILILDEINQMDPAAVGEAAYLLANGQGKTRANRAGMARKALTWRLFFLSAGEESLSGLMARADRRASAGQEIRLAEIDADAGAGMGMFESLNELANAAALAAKIKEDTAKYYGATGVEWMRHVVSERATLKPQLEVGIRKFLAAHLPGDAIGQVERVARRFALVGVAGELATLHGLTGWLAGEAMQAAATCLAVWRESFGEANREASRIAAAARAFFEAHGASRFQYLHDIDEQRLPNRAGFYQTNADNEREYIVLPEVFRKEFCQGFGEKLVKATLIDAGMLIPDKNGRPTQQKRLPGLDSVKAYVFRYNGLEP